MTSINRARLQWWGETHLACVYIENIAAHNISRPAPYGLKDIHVQQWVTNSRARTRAHPHIQPQKKANYCCMMGASYLRWMMEKGENILTGSAFDLIIIPPSRLHVWWPLTVPDLVYYLLLWWRPFNWDVDRWALLRLPSSFFHHCRRSISLTAPLALSQNKCMHFKICSRIVKRLDIPAADDPGRILPSFLKRFLMFYGHAP